VDIEHITSPLSRKVILSALFTSLSLWLSLCVLQHCIIILRRTSVQVHH